MYFMYLLFRYYLKYWEIIARLVEEYKNYFPSDRMDLKKSLFSPCCAQKGNNDFIPNTRSEQMYKLSKGFRRLLKVKQ